jgi:TonB family protein
MLVGCAANRKTRHETQDQGPLPSEKIEPVSRNIDLPPEPVGGIEAIQAALREPEEQSKGNKEGWVVVEATISAQGRVTATKIAESSGFPGMDTEAMLAVSRVTWKPARRRGTPVVATVRVPVVFEKN